MDFRERNARLFDSIGFFDEALKEVESARVKFPSNDRLLGALMEEVGELAKALIEHGSGVERVAEEAVQVAAMACRLATEGDPDYSRDKANQTGPEGGDR